jgi:flagellar basal-body rod modification protein FlgD
MRWPDMEIKNPSAAGAAGAGSHAKSASSGRETLEGDAFLKLLVTQLQHQDPLQPMGAPELMAQTAQFQAVQKLGDMATQLLGMSRALSLVVAVGLVGKTVEVALPGSDVREGQVTAARFGPEGVRLLVDGMDVGLEAVRSVRIAG